MFSPAPTLPNVSPPPPPLAPAVVGIDLGGTKTAGALVRLQDGAVFARRIIPTSPGRRGDAILDDVVQLAAELSRQADEHALEVECLGLGICEIVDAHGKIRSSNAITWEHLEVERRLSKVATPYIEADVRAGALAEARFGAGRGKRNFVYVTIGTGISSCLVLDGQPYAGSSGAAGTLASSPLPTLCEGSDSRPALSLEQLASGPALVSRFQDRGGRADSGEEVFAAASAGDAQATAVVREGARALGAALGWVVNVLDPELVILGGGLGLSTGLYHDTLIEAARRHIWWRGHRHLPIVPAATGLDAGVIGAALAAAQRHSLAGQNR